MSESQCILKYFFASFPFVRYNANYAIQIKHSKTIRALSFGEQSHPRGACEQARRQFLHRQPVVQREDQAEQDSAVSY